MSYSYERKFFGYLENLRTYMVTRPMTLGGIAAANGGAGGPPGGFVGYLPQSRVAYDTTEASTLFTPLSGYSLVDNLNHIRARLTSVEASGSGTGGHIIQHEGISKTARSKLNFIGSGISVSDNSGNDSTDITITISGGSSSEITTHNLTAQIGGTQHFTYSGESHNPAVYVNGLRQVPDIDYLVDVDGLGITISGYSPVSGDSIVIDKLSSGTSGSGPASAGWQTLSNTPTVSWDLALGNAQVTLSGSHNLALATNMTAGNSHFLKINQTSDGNGILVPVSGYKFPGGTQPVLTSAHSGVDIIQFFTDGVNMFGNILSNFLEIGRSKPVLKNISTGYIGGGAGGINFNHNIQDGTNRLLVVLVGLVDAIGPVTGVTFGGVPLTNCGSISAGVGDYPRSEIWYLVSPAVSTDAVVVSFTGGNNYATATAADWTSANQLVPLGEFAYETALSSTLISSLSTGLVGSVAVSCVSYWNNAGDVSTDVGQTVLGSPSADGAWKSSTSYADWTDSLAMGWDIATSTNMALGVVTINPV
jgi:hypothetical protein